MMYFPIDKNLKQGIPPAIPTASRVTAIAKEASRIAAPTPPIEVKPAEEIPSLPSMAVMAKNLASSVGSVVKGALKKESIKLTELQAKTRLEICKQCKFFRHSDQRCSQCGCYMQIKTYLRAVSCPKGYWT